MKRITIIGGHYGSGKSEISVNLALNNQVDYIVDLDIMNPYFRSRALHELFEEHNIHLVESTIKGMLNSDMPYVSGEGKIPFINKDLTAIYDLGGTEHGAKVLIQFQDHIVQEELDFFVSINIYRPETSTKEKIIHTIQLLEGMTQLKITGFINNTNLMDETTEQDVLDGQEVIHEVSKELGIPIVYTVIEEHKNFTADFMGQRLTLNRYVARKWL